MGSSSGKGRMKIALVSYGTNHFHPGFQILAKSSERWGWDFRPSGHGERWSGFCGKFRGVKAAIPKLRTEGYTHLVFADAYDSLIVGPPHKFDKLVDSPGIVWSCEKACWPPPVDANRYPETSKSEWRYLNSGGYFGSLEAVDEFLDDEALNCEDDQWESAERFLADLESGSPKMRLDDGCDWFQSIAHACAFSHQKWEDTFDALSTIDTGEEVAVFRNKITRTLPVVIHGNGGTDMSWFLRHTGDL